MSATPRDATTHAGFTVERGRTGSRLVVNGPWRPAIGEYMRRERIYELTLNYVCGWDGGGIGFLETLPFLTAFSIVGAIDDISPVHALHELRVLEIRTSARTAIDFSCFPDLADAVIDWTKGSDSLFGCVSLRRLYLDRYRGGASAPFAGLVNLKSLSIVSSPLQEVVALGELRNLTFLGLYYLSKLTSLRGIDRLTGLRRLDIQACRRLTSIAEVADLRQLQWLFLTDDGRIASLKPIVGLADLEFVIFCGTTIIDDGDMSPLNTLPRLRSTAFMNRRHYSHRHEDFPRGLKPDWDERPDEF